jgi:hypothetical protein
MQRNRLLIQADDRLVRIIGPFIDGQNLFHLLDVRAIQIGHAPHFFPATVSTRGLRATPGLSLVPLSAPACVSRPPGQSNARSSDRSPRADRRKPWRRHAVAGWDSGRERHPVAAGRTKLAPDLSADNGLRSVEPLWPLGRDWRLLGQRFVRRPTTTEPVRGGPPEPAGGLHVAVPEALSGPVLKGGHAVDDRFVDRNISRRKRIKVLCQAVIDLVGGTPVLIACAELRLYRKRNTPVSRRPAGVGVTTEPPRENPALLVVLSSDTRARRSERYPEKPPRRRPGWPTRQRLHQR